MSKFISTLLTCTFLTASTFAFAQNNTAPAPVAPQMPSEQEVQKIMEQVEQEMQKRSEVRQERREDRQENRVERREDRKEDRMDRREDRREDGRDRREDRRDDRPKSQNEKPKMERPAGAGQNQGGGRRQ